MATKTVYASKDAIMGKAIGGGTFSGWNGRDNHLPAGTSFNSTFKYRSVVYFPIDFSDMEDITGAQLHLSENTTGSNLHCQQGATSTIYYSRMTKDWGEGADPGEGQLTSSLQWEWDNEFDHFTQSIIDSGYNQTANSHDYHHDVLAIVQDWFNGSPNYGIMIRNNVETVSDSNKGVQFYSREKGGDDRPYIVITYTTNTAPTTPTLNSPIRYQTINSLTPDFSGNRNDPDAGDYITGVQIQVAPKSSAYWTYDTSSTAATDPGSGKIKFNSTSVVSITRMYISETSANAIASASEIASWAGKHIAITSPQDNNTWLYYTITTVTDNGAWNTLILSIDTVTPTSGAISNGDSLYVMSFSVYDTLADTLSWDSGVIPFTGNPSSFSRAYGVQGIADSLVGNSYYCWRARTKDKGNLWSPWSLPEVFKVNSIPDVPTVAVVTTPINDVPDITPDFSITHNDADPGDSKMYSYQIIVESESAAGIGDWATLWDSGNVDTSGAPVTTVTRTSGTLAWGASCRVRGRTKDSNNAWSNFCPNVAFTIHKTGVPINLDPSNDESVGSAPTFYGEQATSADTIASYEITVYTDNLVTTMWTSGVLTTGISGGANFTKVYAGSTLSSGSYYQYKVRVTGTIGGVGAYSALQRFQVNDATVPTWSAPLGTGIASLTPTLTFSRASTFNRAQYELYPATATSTVLGTALFASGTLSATIGAGGLGTQWTASYGGSPALVYATNYKLRGRVSSDAGATWSNWSGLVSFTTDAAGTPTLTSAGGISYPTYPWFTDTTPDLVIARAGSDTIYKARFRVWNEAGTILIFDSGMQGSYGGTTSATYTYAGTTALVNGTTYSWDASYMKTSTSGPTGPFSAKGLFRVNANPDTPSHLLPATDDVIANSLTPLFRASFSDSDVGVFGDTPTRWEVVVETGGGVAQTSKAITSGLLVGDNTYQWLSSDYAFAYDFPYRYRTRFLDSLSAAGAYSGYTAFTMSVPPNGTITSPSNGSTLSSVTHTVVWTYSGGTQSSYVIDIDEAQSDGTILKNVTQLTGTGTATSKVIPSGYLKDAKYYNIKLTVKNTSGLYDPSPSVSTVLIILDAPNPITGLSPDTDSDRSLITLNWDTASLKPGHSFSYYNVYRKLVNDEDWTLMDRVTTKIGDSSYKDWYAGHEVNYQYRVTMSTTKTNVGVELESPDDPFGGSFCPATLDSDVWMLVGSDRGESHIASLPVTDGSHNRPIQQESFETLGSNRKVIIRGFVLGNEGSITCLWKGNSTIQSITDPQLFTEETIIGRRIVDYITNKKGPHILKSPFGDVWDVQFQSPSYQWQSGGNLEIDLSWIETGQTSQVSI